jgi:Ca-activated chloride channel homolog
VGLEVKFPFLLLFFIPALILVGLFLKKNRKRESLVIAGLRLGLFTLLILALAVPQILLPVRGETVVFLVDRSDSVKSADGVVLDWIDKNIKSKDSEDAFSIVTMAKDGYIEQSLSQQQLSLTDFNGEVDGTETNLEAGMQLAASLIPKESGGRIVLISDGNETVGESKEAAKLLQNANIELDYALLNQLAAADMSLSDLQVPPSLYKGEEAQITLTIDSNANKTAAVRISVNDQEVLTESIEVKEGKNVYRLSHKVEETGMVVFKAELTAVNDTYIENNALYTVSNAKGTPKVLVVQGKDTGDISSILEAGGLLVDTVSPTKLPTVLSGYLPYQSIIFNNVPATVISESQMTIIERAVKEFGTGFVMAGGEESFGLGGYFKTPIEQLLPVDMDIKGKKEMPSLGLMIVMDRSGSMSGGKLELAKEAAARSVELLREEDTLGFIAFDDRPWVIVETAPLKDKKETVEKILGVSPGGGTEIYSSLALAYEELTELKLQRKHIILLTDGQSATSADYESLIAEGKESNITLSTVAIGSDADRGLLEDLALQGSGRFYDVTDASVIPSILSRETVMATRTYIEDNPFYPVIGASPDWSFLTEAGVPQMNAYIATTAKQRASVPFLSEKEDPVLAEWQYGLGHTIAFTSDFSGKWSGDWARWEKWPLFINHLVTRTLPQYESEPYKVTLTKDKGGTTIGLESASSDGLPIETSVVSEQGKVIGTNSRLVAPGKYQLALPEASGMYFLNIKRTDQNGDVQVYQTGFTVPYSDEYLLKPANRELLKELADMTGGRELAGGRAEAFRPTEKKTYLKQSISQWLLLLAFFLYFLEIAIRRFGLHRLFGRFSQPKAVTETASVGDGRGLVDLRRMPRGSKSKQPVPVKASEENVNKTPEANQPSNERKQTKAKRAKPIEAVELTAAEKEERMKRLLEAKKRKER